MPKTRHNSNPSAAGVYRRLAGWFRRHARAFPWRGVKDPYRVWVSEIILVQTTAAVGTERYRRFLRRFPTLRLLAAAPLDAVMKEWEGLGYYHRASLLHRAAQIIVREYGGRFPSTYESIRALPGVGDYCAAAIHNFCFGGRRPPLDANVARVGARLFGVAGDVRATPVRKTVQAHLAEWMVVGSGAVWTDALIDLGATVCLPRQPRCEVCPLQTVCRAKELDRQREWGLPAARPRQRNVNVACGIIRRADGRILIAQRLATGLLPNLWEFPGGKRDGNESLADTCRREIREELDVIVDVEQRRMVIEHGYSHYAVRLHAFECHYRHGTPRAIGCQRFRWVRIADLATLAFPAANRRIIDDLVAESTG